MKICDKANPFLPNHSKCRFSMALMSPASYVCLFSYFFRVKSEIIQDFLRLLPHSCRIRRSSPSYLARDTLKVQSCRGHGFCGILLYTFSQCMSSAFNTYHSYLLFISLILVLLHTIVDHPYRCYCGISSTTHVLMWLDSSSPLKPFSADCIADTCARISIQYRPSSYHIFSRPAPALQLVQARDQIFMLLLTALFLLQLQQSCSDNILILRFTISAASAEVRWSQRTRNPKRHRKLPQKIGIQKAAPRMHIRRPPQPEY